MSSRAKTLRGAEMEGGEIMLFSAASSLVLSGATASLCLDGTWTSDPPPLAKISPPS